MDNGETSVIEAQSKIKQKESEISRQLSMIEQLQNEISGKNLKIKKMNAKAQSMQQEISRLCDDNYRLSADIDCKEQQIATEKQLLDDRLKRQKELRKKLIFLNNTENELKIQAQGLKEQMDNCFRNEEVINQKITTIKQQQQTAAKENKEINKTKDVLSQISREYEITKSKIQSLERNHDTTTKEIFTLSDTIRKQKEKKTMLQQEASNLESNIQMLRDSINKKSTAKYHLYLQDDVNDLEDKLADLNSKTSALQVQNKFLTNLLSEMVSRQSNKDNLIYLRQEIDKMKLHKPESGIQQLSQEIKSVQSQIVEEENSNKQILLERNSLSSQLENLKERYTQSIQVLSTLQQDRQQLQEYKATLLSKSSISHSNEIEKLRKKTKQLDQRLANLEDVCNIAKRR